MYNKYMTKSEFEKQFGFFYEKYSKSSGDIYGIKMLSDTNRETLKAAIDIIEDLIYLHPVQSNWGKEVCVTCTHGRENCEPLVCNIGDPVDALWALYWASEIEYIISPGDGA